MDQACGGLGDDGDGLGLAGLAGEEEGVGIAETAGYCVSSLRYTVLCSRGTDCPSSRSLSGGPKSGS